MIITATLPKDRIGEGTIEWDNDSGCGCPQSQTARCRGKADSQKAAEMGNPTRDPRRPWGDHPAGRYVVTGVRETSVWDYIKYGPFKIDIQPEDLSSDDECAARENAEAGDDGILIHGGAPQPDGVSLRATYGCLRVGDATAITLSIQIKAALAAGEDVLYICTIR